MRPTSKRTTIILTNYNFHEWFFELDNLCTRERAKTEKEKFAWLCETICDSDKRIVMKYKTESTMITRQVGDKTETVVISGEQHPYTWAIEILRKAKLEGNAVKEEDKFEKKEHEKDRIKSLKISKFKFDLDEFYNNFDQCAVSALSIGCDLPEKYLMKCLQKDVWNIKI
jgi:hypothetical protein